MEAKKISFGFMKIKKQDKPVVTEKKEYIECVEEKSIKVVGGENVKEEAPLIIPMKPNTLITAERLKEIAEKVENFEEPIAKENEQEIKEEKPPENETLDQMAARELLQEAKKEKIVETPKLVVVPTNSKLVMDGQKESTLDDYDSIPIQDFGLAMLRGMGWTPGKKSTYKQPPLRPKGLGLGADKIIADKKKKTNSKDKEEELSIVKNSCVKITSGKHSGFYGKVVSLDEDSGRIMVDITIKKETVSLNEFMVEAVTKSEFDKQSKVINSDSYQEYKKKENISNSSRNQSSTANPEEKKEGKSSRKLNNRDEENRRLEEYNSNGRSRSKERRHRKESTSSEEKRSKHRRKHKKRYSSNESISSDSSQRESFSRKRDSSSDSSSNHKRKHKSSKSKDSKERRDIDKKRKGKKKKRDRDRSPNYKKHRK